MIEPLVKQLLEAGVHFGHQTRRWNPKMSRYIFGEKNGIYLLDLEKTAQGLVEARQFLRSAAAQGGSILFVGTKRQAQPIVAEEATRCGQFYVNLRWLGGLLTNFQTIRKSVERLKTIQRWAADGTLSRLTKKEAAHKQKELGKLTTALTGIIEMDRLPKALVVVDAKREETAVREARRLGIPVVALVDTNSDPDPIDFVIPGNDDAIRSIHLILSRLADGVLEGYQTYLAGLPAKKEAQVPVPAEVTAAPEAGGEAAVAPAETQLRGPLPEVPPVEAPEAIVPEAVLKVEEAAPPRKKRVTRQKPKAKEEGPPQGKG